MEHTTFTEFTVNSISVWGATSPFGGGHTTDTDPTRQGWRVKAISPTLAVVGMKGGENSASVMALSDGRLDVLIYDNVPPGALERMLKEGRGPVPDATFILQATPGGRSKCSRS